MANATRRMERKNVAFLILNLIKRKRVAKLVEHVLRDPNVNLDSRAREARVKKVAVHLKTVNPSSVV